jgi:hypothetical protein
MYDQLTSIKGRDLHVLTRSILKVPVRIIKPAEMGNNLGWESKEMKNVKMKQSTTV